MFNMSILSGMIKQFDWSFWGLGTSKQIVWDDKWKHYEFKVQATAEVTFIEYWVEK